MARRRGRRRGRGSSKIPILSVAILGGQAFLANAGGGSAGAKISRFASYYTGFDVASGGSQFDGSRLLLGYGPWVVKRFATKFARPASGLGRFLPVSLS